MCNFFVSVLVPQKHTNIFKITYQQWTQLYHLDNRSYSTIQPLTYPTYIMKIGEWLSLWDFFNNLSQKLIRTTHQNSHQTCKEVKRPHMIRSSSQVTHSNGILTNMNVT